MTGKNEEWKFFLKNGALTVVLIVAANIFSLFVINEISTGRENGDVDFVFLFSLVALAAVLVVVINVKITYILPIVRQNIKERKLAKEDQ